jgi:hypothetical protein
MKIAIPIPSSRPNVSIHSRWVPELRTFKTRIFVESILNNNTKLWTKGEVFTMGDKQGEFPSVEVLLKALEGRDYTDFNFVMEKANFIVNALEAEQHGLT